MLTRLFVFTLALFAALPALADSFWDHNGSLMRLTANGQARSFTYAAPRPGMVEVGVRPGTLFFNGYRDGNLYYGTARVFSDRCGANTFHIEGWLTSETHMVLEGWRPVFRNCRPTSQKVWERLEFTYRYSD
ncbi:MAG: hypothetical protein CSA74_06785 [Rhodobacterales bacterium]|nr:MAG: hypothetical protein CSA74_06785 [Rhodobacterales bacterium]